MKKIFYTLFAFYGFISLSAQAADNAAVEFARQFNVARTLADEYGAEAKRFNPKSTLTASAGRAFYTKNVVVGGKDLSCSACHTDNPVNPGKHIETGKSIKPLAISANPDAFSDEQKVKKNFLTHCRDLYGRDCSAQEKGDYLTYLLTLQ